MATTPTIDPSARRLMDAVEHELGERNGNGFPSTSQARRVASRVGHGLLAASHQETARHCDQVVVISRALCHVLDVNGSERQDLLAAARLHDIGKIAIPGAILEKPGPLNSLEREQMRTHTIAGAEMLSGIPELAQVATLVRSSHERWDGTGYPDGLRRNEIPLGSRIILCADAFDAIQSDRPYRNRRSEAEALVEIRRHSGTQFDPEVVRALAAATGPALEPL